jgi:hypothetical protein
VPVWWVASNLPLCPPLSPPCWPPVCVRLSPECGVTGDQAGLASLGARHYLGRGRRLMKPLSTPHPADACAYLWTLARSAGPPGTARPPRPATLEARSLPGPRGRLACGPRSLRAAPNCEPACRSMGELTARSMVRRFGWLHLGRETRRGVAPGRTLHARKLARRGRPKAVGEEETNRQAWFGHRPDDPLRTLGSGARIRT